MSTSPTVARVMTRLVMTIAPEARLDEAARLMREWHVSGLPVVDEKGQLVGVVSEKDLVEDLHKVAGISLPRGLLDLLLGSSSPKGQNLLEVCQNRLRNTRVREVMTAPATTVTPETPLMEAARLLKSRGVSRLPVLDADNHVVGILTRRDIADDLSDGPKRARGSMHPRHHPPSTSTEPTDAFQDN
jgi:CBS domain-containing protein